MMRLRLRTKVVPQGMNVLCKLRSLIAGLEGVQKMDRHNQRFGSSNLHCVLAQLRKVEQFVGRNGKRGW